MENASEIVLFKLTTQWVDEYRVVMMSRNCLGYANSFQNVSERVGVQRVKCNSEVDVSGV